MQKDLFRSICSKNERKKQKKRPQHALHSILSKSGITQTTYNKYKDMFNISIYSMHIYEKIRKSVYFTNNN